MILAIDVGNSNIVLGGYSQDTLLFTVRVSSDVSKTSDEYAVQIKSVLTIHNIEPEQITGSIISSVVPQITLSLRDALVTLTGQKPMIVEPGIKTGINIRIDNPAQLGSDLLVDSVAAAALYPLPAIVIDMGTATTLGVVDQGNAMLGGAIFPGVRVSVNALSNQTAQLPYISIQSPKRAIGANTIDCMQSGMVFGTASMLDGMIDRFQEELGKKCTVVATGGLAEEICRHTRHKIHYNPNLLLEGLHIIYKKNTDKKGQVI